MLFAARCSCRTVLSFSVIVLGTDCCRVLCPADSACGRARVPAAADVRGSVPNHVLTIGFLLAESSLPRVVAVIPLLWAFIAGSSAFLLGVRADLMLLRGRDCAGRCHDLAEGHMAEGAQTLTEDFIRATALSGLRRSSLTWRDFPHRIQRVSTPFAKFLAFSTHCRARLLLSPRTVRDVPSA